MIVNLKQARKLNEYSQQQIADLLGIHVQTYGKWEENPDIVRVGDAKKLSKIFGISYDDIFFSSHSTLSRVTGKEVS